MFRTRSLSSTFHLRGLLCSSFVFSTQPRWGLSEFNSSRIQTLISQRNFASGESLQLWTDGSIHKVVIPLKTGETLFSVTSQHQVKDLISFIHQEDPSVDVSIFSASGYKVSGSILIRDIITEGFEIKLGSTPYKVPAQKNTGTLSGFRGHIDANTIIEKENYSRVIRYLKDDVRSTISVEEFLRICLDYEIYEPEALNLLKSLHHCGVVLNFHESAYLKNLVFVHPREVTQKVLDSLRIPTTICSEVDELIDAIKTQLVPLEVQKQLIDSRARKFANGSLFFGFGFLVVQFGFLAHLVWWKLNWDFMEPVAYFIGFGTTIIAFVWYSGTGRDFMFIDFWDYVRSIRERRLEKNYQFDHDLYHRLKNEIVELERQKERLHLTSKLV